MYMVSAHYLGFVMYKSNVEILLVWMRRYHGKTLIGYKFLTWGLNWYN